MAIGTTVIEVVIGGIVAFVVIGYPVSIYNGFVLLQNNIKKAQANLDVLLKQRSDEVPNLIAAVKGYMKYEKELLTSIAQLRAQMLNATTIGQKSSASVALSQQLKTLFAVSENYPELKASENFLKLQQRITELENQIADRREYYNDSVTTYNTRLQVFPDMIIGKMFSMQAAELFVATAQEKVVPQVAAVMQR